MQYAVIETGGKQYKVTPGQILEVEHLSDGEEGKKLELDKVLLVVDGDAVEIGTPYLSSTSVEATLVKDLRGEKIRVAKFKAKSRYRRVNGHRQSLSQLKIEKIKTKK